MCPTSRGPTSFIVRAFPDRGGKWQVSNSRPDSVRVVGNPEVILVAGNIGQLTRGSLPIMMIIGLCEPPGRKWIFEHFSHMPVTRPNACFASKGRAGIDDAPGLAYTQK